MVFLELIAILFALGAICYWLAYRTRPPATMPVEQVLLPLTYEFPTTFIQTEEILRELSPHTLKPYRLAHSEPRFLVFEERPSLKSFGYYYCLYLSPNERGGTRLEIAIQDRLVNTGSDGRFLDHFSKILSSAVREEIHTRFPAIEAAETSASTQ